MFVDISYIYFDLKGHFDSPSVNSLIAFRWIKGLFLTRFKSIQRISEIKEKIDNVQEEIRNLDMDLEEHQGRLTGN